ncbi:ribbon-helix-helix protein, CopG family [Spirosoma pollinicola]|nr:ribbon-helix-helix protein, CopG family [Spirosoma pollinicola]
MAKEVSFLQVRLSPKLKQQFEQMCAESEISMSDKVREIVANLVRNHNRQTTKGGKAEV